MRGLAQQELLHHNVDRTAARLSTWRLWKSRLWIVLLWLFGIPLSTLCFFSMLFWAYGVSD